MFHVRIFHLTLLHRKRYVSRILFPVKVFQSILFLVRHLNSVTKVLRQRWHRLMCGTLDVQRFSRNHCNAILMTSNDAFLCTLIKSEVAVALVQWIIIKLGRIDIGIFS